MMGDKGAEFLKNCPEAFTTLLFILAGRNTDKHRTVTSPELLSDHFS
jgi:hypothetical protein